MQASTYFESIWTGTYFIKDEKLTSHSKQFPETELAVKEIYIETIKMKLMQLVKLPNCHHIKRKSSSRGNTSNTWSFSEGIWRRRGKLEKYHKEALESEQLIQKPSKLCKKNTSLSNYLLNTSPPGTNPQKNISCSHPKMQFKASEQGPHQIWESFPRPWCQTH